MSTNEPLDRRDFLKSVSATGLTLTAATNTAGRQDQQQDDGGRVIGANDRINVGVIGCGGRGSYDAGALRRIRQEEQQRLPDRRRLRCVREAQDDERPTSTR